MRAALIIMALLYVAGVGYAQSIFIGPELCPVPANVETVRAANAVDADDLNPWRKTGEEAFTAVAVKAGDRNDGSRVYAWLEADAVSGRVVSGPAAACRDQAR